MEASQASEAGPIPVARSWLDSYNYGQTSALVSAGIELDNESNKKG